MLKRVLAFLLILTVIPQAFGIRIRIQQLSKRGLNCMVIFAISNPQNGAPICSPEFGAVKDTLNLEDLGLKNEDPAGYGFGFRESNTQDPYVQPSWYVSKTWTPKINDAVYYFCFYPPFGWTTFKDNDGSPMCEHTWDYKHTKIECSKKDANCPRIPNPFYDHHTQGLNLNNQKGPEIASSQSVEGSDAISASEIQPEDIPYPTSPETNHVQNPDTNFINPVQAKFNPESRWSIDTVPSISFSSKERRHVRSLRKQFLA